MTDDVPSDLPDLSLVVVCAAGGWRIRRTLAGLAAQTIAGRIEVITVSPDPAPAPGTERLLARMHSHRHAQAQVPNVDHAVGRHVLLGRAPLVGSVEDHAFPEPEWAERVIAQFAEDPGCVAVGSAFANANPASAMSWTTFLVALGQWTESTPEGPAASIQLHDTVYRRGALEALGPEIWPLFNRESEVLSRLRMAGGRFRFAPRAVLRHLNCSRWADSARLRFNAGRLYAAVRVAEEGWGWPKRLFYAAGGPLIPLVRYARMRRELFGRSPEVTEARLGGAVLYGLAFDALGQMAAFLSGPGASRARLAEHELDRTGELNGADAAAFGPVR